MTYTFVGDVHGKFDRYRKLIKRYPNSIQIGDMGVGFRSLRGFSGDDMETNPPFDKMVETGARFIRGNHDNPGVCRNHKRWIPDGTVEGRMMLIGGAFSIDWKMRTEGYSWWADEELSQDAFYSLMEVYERERPELMVTHDCPEKLVRRIHSHHFGITTRTGQAFDAFHDIHQPRLWVFGHHHKWFDEVVDGTRFICVPELGVLRVNEETLESTKVTETVPVGLHRYEERQKGTA